MSSSSSTPTKSKPTKLHLPLRADCGSSLCLQAMDFKKHPLPWRVGRERSDNKIPRKGQRQEFANQVYDSSGTHLASLPDEHTAAAVVAAVNKVYANQDDPSLLAIVRVKAPDNQLGDSQRAQAAAQEAAAIRGMMANPAKKKPT